MKFPNKLLLTIFIGIFVILQITSSNVMSMGAKNERTKTIILSPETIAAIEVDMSFAEFEIFKEKLHTFAQENSFYFSIQGEKNIAPIPMPKFISIWMGDIEKRADFDHAIYFFHTDEYQYSRMIFIKEGFVNQDKAEKFSKKMIDKFFVSEGYKVRDVLYKYESD